METVKESTKVTIIKSEAEYEARTYKLEPIDAVDAIL
jgi:hypothetical protein